jgi:hypothetical protein
MSLAELVLLVLLVLAVVDELSAGGGPPWPP